MKRPQLNATVIKALGSVRAAGQIQLDNGETDKPEELRRGIEYIDALRAWYWEQHPEQEEK